MGSLRRAAGSVGGALYLVVGITAACGDSGGRSGAGPLAADGAGNITLSRGGGHESIATGGYHFTVPEDFNGGIFGGTVGNQITFNAKRDADGTVSGHYRYEQEYGGEAFVFSGPVTCFNVYDTPPLDRFPDIPYTTANRAKWGGLIEKSNDPTIPVGTFIWFQSIDNGEGSEAPPDVSTISGFGDEAANEEFCSIDRVPNSDFGPHAVDGGNINVR